MFRQSEALTDKRYKAIIGREDGAELLIEDFLAFIKCSPFDCYVEFVTAIKQRGNRHVKDFVKTKIEPNRKKLYRELFHVQPGMF